MPNKKKLEPLPLKGGTSASPCGESCRQVPCCARLFRRLGLEALQRFGRWAAEAEWTRHQWVREEAVGRWRWGGRWRAESGDRVGKIGRPKAGRFGPNVVPCINQGWVAQPQHTTTKTCVRHTLTAHNHNTQPQSQYTTRGPTNKVENYKTVCAHMCTVCAGRGVIL